MRKILRFAFSFLASLALFFVTFILFTWFTRYIPPTEEPVDAFKIPFPPVNENHISDTLKLVTWNIGYAGLGASMDFFYDGGSKVRCSKQETLENLGGIIHHPSLARYPDFILFQEVDQHAKRTYFINEADSISAAFPNHAAWFVKNYDVLFVPVPWYNPMGRVVAGLVTLSKYQPTQSIRRKLPGEFSFITQLFMLNRCAHILRFPATKGHELVLVNTHNTAFDDGTQRVAQWSFLHDFALNEFSKGNYVIIGGDFNLNPPCFNPNLISTGDAPYRQPGDFPPCSSFPAGWNFIYQQNIPTNRNLDTHYIKGRTPVTTIDFFILSPNISCIYQKTWYDGFRFSDHHPLEIQIVLKK
ncbi:MAG: endonuclease/exonuclease/phosphatase family protein [Bacteroidales bacterium]